ncbi:hypothetical protein OH807_18365 [Kitasatospora sp. NBC_01560]|uniref:hypothetical protein n=1 Tax=Kitasatospora sp. NBC_01560 TaxID=2975965 RepID=UPI00386585B2
MNLAPWPPGRSSDPTWWLVHEKYKHLITPLRARGFVVDIKNAAKKNRRIVAALPDGSRLTITTETGLPLLPENVLNWIVQHEPKGERASVLVYDSTPSGPAAPASTIVSPLLVATDQYLARAGIVEPQCDAHPVAVLSNEREGNAFDGAALIGRYPDQTKAAASYEFYLDDLRRAGFHKLWSHPCPDWPRSLWNRGITLLHAWVDLAELHPDAYPANREAP